MTKTPKELFDSWEAGKRLRQSPEKGLEMEGVRADIERIHQFLDDFVALAISTPSQDEQRKKALEQELLMAVPGVELLPLDLTDGFSPTCCIVCRVPLERQGEFLHFLRSKGKHPTPLPGRGPEVWTFRVSGI